MENPTTPVDMKQQDAQSTNTETHREHTGKGECPVKNKEKRQS